MKQICTLFMLIFFAFIVANIHAQNTFPSTGAAGIGTTTPGSSSLLEIKSTTKGILIPRMTLTQRNAVLVSTATQGLLIYQTDNTPGFYYYTGSKWTAISVKGANTSLSNLTSTTAINANLLPGTNGSFDLGSTGSKWRDAYLSGNLSARYISAAYLSAYNSADISISGTSISNVGIYGNSLTSYGVYGNSSYLGVYGVGGNWGVYGFSQDNIGVSGVSSNGYGLYAKSDNNIGVYAIGWNDGYGDGYAGYFDGSVYTTVNYQGSDKCLKQDIRDFASAMDIIHKLHPTQYEYRQDGNYKLMHLPKGSHYGLIAQEVEKVLPNLIKETKFDPATATPSKAGDKNISNNNSKADVINFKALNYTELIPIIIKGMQEQQSLINDLAAKNDDLQNQIAELKAMIVSNQSSATILSSTLQQNVPNPFNHTTTIGYSLPQKLTNARIIITDKLGNTLKTINISGSGKGSVNVDAATLSSGAYQYTLLIDGRQIAKKQMILIK